MSLGLIWAAGGVGRPRLFPRRRRKKTMDSYHAFFSEQIVKKALAALPQPGPCYHAFFQEEDERRRSTLTTPFSEQMVKAALPQPKLRRPQKSNQTQLGTACSVWLYNSLNTTQTYVSPRICRIVINLLQASNMSTAIAPTSQGETRLG